MNKQEQKKILGALVDEANIMTGINVSNNKSVTIISSSFGADKKTYREAAFSGCGAVHLAMDGADWRLAKELGFHKCYRNWQFGGKYYNGQFGDACDAWADTLDKYQRIYPGSFLEKISFGSWID